MLHHTYKARVSAPIEACLRCAANPEVFLGKSRYTYSLKRVGNDEYEVVFKWRKLGMTRFYPVRFRVYRQDNRIVYEATHDSPYRFSIIIELVGVDNETEVTVRAEMDAGILASLLGRGDFSSFIEELVDSGIAGMAKDIVRESEIRSRPRASCTSCFLYDPSRGYCYVLRAGVRDPESPPCRGEYFIDKSMYSRQ